jgi:head-tail adaptor
MPSASDLTERLTIITDTRTPGTGGSGTVSPSDAATVWGYVWPLKGAEAMEARQVVGGTTYRCGVRYPLPAGVALASSGRVRWERTSAILHLNGPPALTPDRRFLAFEATEKEAA